MKFALKYLFTFLSSNVAPLVTRSTTIGRLIVANAIGGGSDEGGLRGIGISIINGGVKAIAGTSNAFSLGMTRTRTFHKLRISRVNCLAARLSLRRLRGANRLAV